MRQRQVWSVVYDSDTPSMDGSHPPVRMAEQDRERAEVNFALIQARSTRSPKRNLRIETRWVTPWEPVTTTPTEARATRGEGS